MPGSSLEPISGTSPPSAESGLRSPVGGVSSFSAALVCSGVTSGITTSGPRVGASLVPRGGQNPLEAAQLGCALAFGPHMTNCRDIADALDAPAIGDAVAARTAVMAIYEGRKLAMEL